MQLTETQNTLFLTNPIKVYHLPDEYDTMAPITFYDADGEAMPIEDIVGDIDDNSIGNFHQ